MTKTILKAHQVFMRIARREDGQGLPEYGLLIALVAAIAIAALSLLGGNVTSTIRSVGGTL